MTSGLEALSAAIADLKREEAVKIVGLELATGTDPTRLLEACRQGMQEVGGRFEAGRYYLAELILAAEIFKAAAERIAPHLARTAQANCRGRVVLATMRGDIHDLGKNIFATLLKAQGFEVRDLGVNVPPQALAEAVERDRPQFVGMSVLITTAFPAMREAVDLLAGRGLRESLRVLIGGGVTTPELAEWLGADFQTRDASAGVAYCLAESRRNQRGGVDA